MQTLIVCVGNEQVCDDGIGARVGRILQLLPLPADVGVTVVQRVGLDLLDAVAAAEHVVVVDALDSEAEPGTCTVGDVTELPPTTVGAGCAHASCVGEIIAMARQLSCDGFKQVTLAGIERKLTLECCSEFSEEVTTAVPRLVDLILLVVGAQLETRFKVKETCRRFVVPTNGAFANLPLPQPRPVAVAMWQ